ncbi:MAG: hypothetical protein J0H06_14780 [Actinobacteria bacterium]|nr:hypothetical protein [Actinomycetota bacterium]
MQPIETAVSNPRLDHFLPEPKLAELPPPHNPVLSPGERGDLPIKNFRVEFRSLRDQKSTRVFHADHGAPGMRTRGARFVPFQ